jgi:predicted Zn-dependent protease
MSAKNRAVRMLSLAFVSVCLSCAAVSQLNLLTTDQEVEIGRQAAQEVEREVSLYRDPVVTAYVDSLGQALVLHSKRPKLKYSFKVVDTDQVNAFALPGGWLYVNRGLITAAENESELAGVIGHEIGHVVGKHGARQISKQYGFAVLVELAVGGENPSLARQIAGQFAAMGAGLTLLKYGRDAEREADYFAVSESHSAGINPEGMATFFEKLMAQHESEPEGAAEWFSTHPASQERIANVREQIAKLPHKSGLKTDSKRFQEIKARILKKAKKGRGRVSGRAKGRVPRKKVRK